MLFFGAGAMNGTENTAVASYVASQGLIPDIHMVFRAWQETFPGPNQELTLSIARNSFSPEKKAQNINIYYYYYSTQVPQYSPYGIKIKFHMALI